MLGEQGDQFSVRRLLPLTSLISTLLLAAKVLPGRVI